MKVLFATAELAPLVRVGGLAKDDDDSMQDEVADLAASVNERPATSHPDDRPKDSR